MRQPDEREIDRFDAADEDGRLYTVVHLEKVSFPRSITGGLPEMPARSVSSCRAARASTILRVTPSRSSRVDRSSTGRSAKARSTPREARLQSSSPAWLPRPSGYAEDCKSSYPRQQINSPLRSAKGAASAPASGSLQAIPPWST